MPHGWVGYSVRLLDYVIIYNRKVVSSSLTGAVIFYFCGLLHDTVKHSLCIDGQSKTKSKSWVEPGSLHQIMKTYSELGVHVFAPVYQSRNVTTSSRPSPSVNRWKLPSPNRNLNLKRAGREGYTKSYYNLLWLIFTYDPLGKPPYIPVQL